MGCIAVATIAVCLPFSNSSFWSEQSDVRVGHDLRFSVIETHTLGRNRTPMRPRHRVQPPLAEPSCLHSESMQTT
eukprot:3684235-Amphidinium_carterae.1